MRSRRLNTLRAWLAKLALAILSLLVTALVAEVALRLLWPQPLQVLAVWPDGTQRHLPSISFRYTRRDFSNVVSYNSLGMRGPEVAVRREPGVPRVLFLGDSFIEGKQVADDEVLTAVMSRLGAETGTPVEVINLGVDGYGTGKELLLWERLGRSLDPDLVLLGFFANDLRNNHERGIYALEEGELVRRREPHRPRSGFGHRLRKQLDARSHLYTLYQLGREGLKRRLRVSHPPPMGDADAFARQPREAVLEAWDLTLSLLDALRGQVHASGARFALVLIPTRFQVDGGRWEALVAGDGLEPEAYDLQAPRRLLDWGVASGTPVIDLLDVFRERNVSNSFYYDTDGHWNPAGHQLAGRLILERLLRDGLLDRE